MNLVPRIDLVRAAHPRANSLRGEGKYRGDYDEQTE